MTTEEWETSDCAQSMLLMLREEHPGFLSTQVRQLHRFLIACCWKHQNLIPQEGLRNGLRGAENWLAGEISNDELDQLNWHAEADAFAIDYAKTQDEISDLKNLIDGIQEVRELPFDHARALLKSAAYFAEGSMIYPRFNSLPWIGSLFESEFLCSDLLREFVKPSL